MRFSAIITDIHRSALVFSQKTVHFRGVKPTEVKLVTPGENLLRHTAKWRCLPNGSITTFLQNSFAVARKKTNFCACAKFKT